MEEMDEMEEKLIGQEDDKRPRSYTLLQKQKRETLAKEKEDDAKKIFLTYLEFYNENYPSSTHDLTWSKAKINFKFGKEDFNIELDKLNEEKLYDARQILEYGRKEAFSSNMQDHYAYLHAKALIEKRIPGIKYLNKLEAINEKEQEIEREKARLLKLIEKERFEFAKKHVEIIEESNERKYICKFCGHDCTNGSGLASHMKTHESQTE